MADLAAWLEAHSQELTQAATEALSENALLRAQVVEVVKAFYEALGRCAEALDTTPLYSLLFDWMETRFVMINDETDSLAPVLARLKTVTGSQILRTAGSAEMTELYVAADLIFSDALVFLSAIEAEDLMVNAREQLAKAEKEIARLNKSKSDFIAIAAHELKTPLTIIEGYAGMIRATQEPDGDPMILELSTGIETGLRRLRELVEDLVDVSIIEMNLLKLNFQQTFFHSLLDSLERNLAPDIAQRQQQLVVQRETFPALAIYADPDRLQQVVRKVASNAIKYTPDGGTITISGRALPGFLDLMVIDSGVGIAGSRLATIFDAFSSAGDVSLHSSGKVKFKGSGPGLSLPIAKGIIEAHGGSIWAQSPGYNEKTCPGSTFHIMVPLRTERPDSSLGEDAVVDLFEP